MLQICSKWEKEADEGCEAAADTSAGDQLAISQSTHQSMCLKQSVRRLSGACWGLSKSGLYVFLCLLHDWSEDSNGDAEDDDREAERGLSFITAALALCSCAVIVLRGSNWTRPMDCGMDLYKWTEQLILCIDWIDDGFASWSLFGLSFAKWNCCYCSYNMADVCSHKCLYRIKLRYSAWRKQHVILRLFLQALYLQSEDGWTSCCKTDEDEPWNG